MLSQSTFIVRPVPPSPVVPQVACRLLFLYARKPFAPLHLSSYVMHGLEAMHSCSNVHLQRPACAAHPWLIRSSLHRAACHSKRSLQGLPPQAKPFSCSRPRLHQSNSHRFTTVQAAASAPPKVSPAARNMHEIQGISQVNSWAPRTCSSLIWCALGCSCRTSQRRTRSRLTRCKSPQSQSMSLLSGQSVHSD